MVGLHPKGLDKPSVKRPQSFEKPRNVDAGDLLVVDAVARVSRYPWVAVVEADLRRQVLARRLVRIQPEKPAGRLVHEINHPQRIQQDHPLLQGLEHPLQKSLLANQARDDLLDLAVLDAVQTGHEFFQETGFH